ncbi:transcription factor HES-5-like [Myxocyprinus asiaticus]|uniref:transcription factor HES-5-like n=1 Tax=Myxocyprinus asiaticus TaxID=70543 RepID=UPI0022214130|nr:transcription factor HES-5-like [Myxocyprinus asiaticus]XP_051532459.1 transcription factor HES-5-like [Myxocyprinus asiaticus]
MTPTIISKEHLPLNNKVRKPTVEKMRRERINSSIEQLKCLLAPEFLKQQPDTKLEKADILEMTVSFLRHQQSVLDSSSHAVNQGFSRCVCEIVHFLSKDDLKTQRRHFQNLQISCEQNRRESVLPQLNSSNQNTFSKEMNVSKSTVWRPW